MKYVILRDRTRIDNCNDSTTSNSIFAVRDSYEAAGAVRDLFNPENSSVIRVYNEDGTESVVGSDLVLQAGCRITEDGDKFVCEITTRVKTAEEKMQDEIAELQEVVLGEES